MPTPPHAFSSNSCSPSRQYPDRQIPPQTPTPSVAWSMPDFADECAFLAELVKVPSDNPPGDCAPHARRARRAARGARPGSRAHAVPETGVRRRHDLGHEPDRAPALRRRARRSRSTRTATSFRPARAGRTIHTAPKSWTVRQGPTMYGRGVAVSKSDFATYTLALLALRAAAAQGATCAARWSCTSPTTRKPAEDRPALAARRGLSDPTWRSRRLFLCRHHRAQRLPAPRGVGARQAGPRSDARTRRRCARGRHRHPDRTVCARERIEARPFESARHRPPQLNVGLIAGGINTNVVPDRITFRIDRRIIPERTPPGGGGIAALIEAAAARIPLGRGPPHPAGPAAAPAAGRRAAGRGHLPPRQGDPRCRRPSGRAALHRCPALRGCRHPTVLYGAGPRSIRSQRPWRRREPAPGRPARATKTVALTLAELLRAE